MLSEEVGHEHAIRIDWPSSVRISRKSEGRKCNLLLLFLATFLIRNLIHSCVLSLYLVKFLLQKFGTMTCEYTERAAAYPFDTPLESFVFVAGKQEEGPLDIVGRQPVLALGSNASPVQLARKFGTKGGPIPVSQAILEDHVIVFSAHFTAYGSLPATSHRVPGARAFAFLTWLDPDQLRRMHETENVGTNYDYRVRDNFAITTDGRPIDVPVGVYESRRGPLSMRGNPVRIAEIASTGSVLHRLTQRAVLRHVGNRLAPEAEFMHFVQRIVEDQVYRSEMTERLATLDDPA